MCALACLVLVVAAMLQSPMRENNADIVYHGLLAIASLADGNITNATLLGKAGACAGAVMSGLE